MSQPPSPAVGFVKGRNPVDFVLPHLGSTFSLKMDLQQFFPSIRTGRIFGTFKSMGYSAKVARLLAALCTVATDRSTLEQLSHLSSHGQSLHHLHARRHLPQGAPTSPALSNLCAYKLDCRLQGLATYLGGVYCRYADDLLFSFDETIGLDGQSANRLRRLAGCIATIALEEGFTVNHRKTRILHAAQRKMAAGIVFNQRPNVTRREFDQLKAILYNCIRYGPESQNQNQLPHFQQHLKGRIGWVQQLNPNRAEKLQRLYDQIQW